MDGELMSKVCGWKSVKDGLPDEGTNVLACFVSGYDKSLYVAVGSFDWHGEEGGWLWSQGNGYGELETFDTECDDDYRVTHWMPIPTPPAKRKAAKKASL
jgi:hypothetical protein